jgi:WD40 repeat protein
LYNNTRFKPTALKCLYYDPLELLIVSFDDHKIVVWGYQKETCDDDSKGDEMSSKVCGLSERCILKEHKNAVTAIVAFSKEDLFGKHWLISGGMDRRLIVWNLEKGSYLDSLKSEETGKDELAADGLITDIDYCPQSSYIGYSSSDTCAYIRKFDTSHNNLSLIAVLQGHLADVTCIKYNRVLNEWITGSEDKTIRIWPSEGIPCLRVISNEGPVSCLCLDYNNEFIITGSFDKVLRVIHGDEIVQKYVGHSDCIRSVIYLASRKQYITASWDQTIRVWNAYDSN